MKQSKVIGKDGSFTLLKGIILLLFFTMNGSRIYAQYALGTTGQLMIPTAEMQETGTFMGGANFLPEQTTPEIFGYPTMSYYVDMTLFSFIELGYRMTLLKMKSITGKATYSNQDRSNTIRIRPLKESRYFPAVVIGTNDFLTEKATQYWGAYYGVLTKTLSWGRRNRLAVTAGWYVHQGNVTPYNEGLFGGVRYTPSFCNELKLMAEYDTRGWNFGGAIRLWKHLSVHVFTREFTCVSAGLRYECTLIH